MRVYIVAELKHTEYGDYNIRSYAFSDITKASEFMNEKKEDYKEAGYEIMSDNDAYIYLEDEVNDTWVQLELNEDEVNQSWKDVKNLNEAEFEVGEWCANSYSIYYDKQRLAEKGFNSIKNYLKDFTNPWYAMENDDVIVDIVFNDIVDVSDSDIANAEIFEEGE
jgi:hypothetical protein